MNSSRPKTRNAIATRANILRAAWRRFADDGYEGAPLRDIASDAGIDVALVSRYFGSKEELFEEVLTSHGPSNILDGGLEGFGERVARTFAVDPVEAGKLDKLLMILRSTSSPKAVAVITRNCQDTFYGPLETLLGGPDRAVRARLVTSMITGFAIVRAIDGDYPSVRDREDLCKRFAILLQQIVDQVPASSPNKKN